jgi:hypothetical protein
LSSNNKIGERAFQEKTIHHNAMEIADAIEEFLTGTRALVTVDRVLATVLFTDIVGSTEKAAKLGDRGRPCCARPRQPAFGQVRIANELSKRGLMVSPAGCAEYGSTTTWRP